MAETAQSLLRLLNQLEIAVASERFEAASACAEALDQAIGECRDSRLLIRAQRELDGLLRTLQCGQQDRAERLRGLGQKSSAAKRYRHMQRASF